jgi:hypothetical protein
MLISDFHAAAEARGDGLHPTLRALLVQAYQTAEITRRVDGMLQAGPSPASESIIPAKNDSHRADVSGTIAIAQRKAR